MALKTFEIKLVTSKMITPSVMELSFEKNDCEQFEFIAGQFITLIFEQEERVKRRSYSVANAPKAGNQFDIVISYIKGGLASEALFNLKPGESLTAMGPAGRLIIKDDDNARYVMVGTGTGVAPYRSMLPQICDLGKADKKVVVLEGVQYPKDLLYHDEFLAMTKEQQHFDYRACLSREKGELSEQQYNGYVQHQFDDLALDPEKDIVYLCGNPNMIDVCFEQLKEMGFPIPSIRREKYISSS